jgi:lysophospholipase L1-like esterase
MKNLLIVLCILALQLNMCAKSPEAASEEYAGKKSTTKQLKILALGDSNGELPDGWVNQLKKIRPNDSIYNISISGNTIGFNNQGYRTLNTLANIDSHMEKAYGNLGNINEIIIMLGTNDCKSVFKDSLSIVPENMRKIIMRIRLYAKLHKDIPYIYIVSPPPFGPDEKLVEKYRGGGERVSWLNEQLRKIAKEENVDYINTFQILLPVIQYLSDDGVHLNAEGQMMIALIIQENLKFFVPGEIQCSH